MHRLAFSVWIVDKNEFEREEISGLINETVDIRCRRTFVSCEEMFTHINRSLTLSWPDIAIINYQLRRTGGPKRMPGIHGIRRLKKINPEINCLVRTRSKSSSLIAQALFAGANGFLKQPASIDTLISTMRASARGGMWMVPSVAKRVLAKFKSSESVDLLFDLSQDEWTLLEMMKRGSNIEDASKALQMSLTDVQMSLKGIYVKLHVRTEAFAVAKSA